MGKEALAKKALRVVRDIIISVFWALAVAALYALALRCM